MKPNPAENWRNMLAILDRDIESAKECHAAELAHLLMQRDTVRIWLVEDSAEVFDTRGLIVTNHG